MEVGHDGVFYTLVPTDNGFTRFEGFVTIAPRDGAVHQQDLGFKISAPLPGGGGGQGCALEAGGELEALLGPGLAGSVRARVAACAAPEDGAAAVAEAVGRALHLAPPAPLPAPSFYNGLLAEIDAVGWGRLVSLGEDLTSLRLRVEDEGGREHEVDVGLPCSYPDAPPEVRMDLPAAVVLRWGPGGSLQGVIAQCASAAARYQGLWEVLEDLDEHAWVLEPERPLRSSTFRRVALGGHVSLSLEVDPSAPRGMPEWRLVGAAGAIAPLQARLLEGRAQWSPHRLLRGNLEVVLGRALPARATLPVEDVSGDCGICYSYRLPGGAIPERVCDNERCGRPFHHECLCGWLHSISSAKQVFTTVFGSCPYCAQEITAQVTGAAA